MFVSGRNWDCSMIPGSNEPATSGYVFYGRSAAFMADKNDETNGYSFAGVALRGRNETVLCSVGTYGENLGSMSLRSTL